MSSALTSAAAERIAAEILSRYDGKILAISIIDDKTGGGNILATKTTESFEKTFGVLQEGPKFGGTLALAALSIANEERGIAGDAVAITTTYKKCKTMLIPIPSYEILVGLVLKRRVVLDEDRIASYIESLVADNDNANTTTSTTTTTAYPPT